MKPTLTLSLLLIACGAPVLVPGPETPDAPTDYSIQGNEACGPQRVHLEESQPEYQLNYKRLYSDDQSYLLVTCEIHSGGRLVSSNTVLWDAKSDAAPWAPCWVTFDAADPNSGGFDFAQENDGSGQVATHYHQTLGDGPEGVWHLNCEAR